MIHIRIFAMKRRNEYLRKQMQQRSDSRNINRNVKYQHFQIYGRETVDLQIFI